MRSPASVITCVALLCGFAVSQTDTQTGAATQSSISRDARSGDSEPALRTRPEPPKKIPMARTIQTGTRLRATLDQSLSSENSTEGQYFTATLTEPLHNMNGDVVVPAGAKVRGQVAEVERGKVFGSVRNAKARLNLRFTELMFPDGSSMPMEASLTSVSGGSKNSVAKAGEEGDVTSNNTGTKTAKDVGIAAGVGTVAGLIFGGAFKGLAIGALAGGGYVLANNGRVVELPQSSELTLQLNQLLTIPANEVNSSANAPVARTHDADPLPARDTDNGPPELKRRPADDRPDGQDNDVRNDRSQQDDDDLDIYDDEDSAAQRDPSAHPAPSPSHPAQQQPVDPAPPR